ncbi:MAG: type II toxin-antitoxin system VapC family toxin [Bacteroidales bacterium]|jgi:PIN domain nuclease of toxin-antitoxin system|nr:type II toxin-antitoxin system VapC family toxin [Bacteroidales bacterium]
MERYLLDTNIVLFYAMQRDRLTKKILAILANYEFNRKFVISAISIAEIGLLTKKGKIKSKWTKTNDILQAVSDLDFEVLPFTKNHADRYWKLDTPNEHKDPFDHIIIAQAIEEKMLLISSDTDFEYYSRQGLDILFNETR